MKTEVKKIADLNPAAYNPRVPLKEGDPDYEKLRKSIETFGHVIPIVWNKRTGNVVGGHQTLQVLKDLGEKETDCTVVNLSLEEEKALNIALNKISGRWDMELLDQVMQELDALDMTSLTGFDEKEVEKILEEISADIVESKELDTEDFAEETFEHKCPRCGFLY